MIVLKNDTVSEAALSVLPSALFSLTIKHCSNGMAVDNGSRQMRKDGLLSNNILWS